MTELERPALTTARRAVFVAGLAVSLLTQLTMVGLGIAFINSESSTALLILLTWCLLGTTYAVVVLIVLGFMSRRNRSEAARPPKLELSRTVRIFSSAATLFASLVGLVAAFQVLSPQVGPDLAPLVTVIGVWAMLLAWGFLHWGFAQIYRQTYFTSATPPMRFPGTPHPGIVEFVYFSYTLGTTFAVSDVEILNTRVRWRVVWHSVLSFFFNGLIVVLALGTIIEAGSSQ